VTRFPLEFDTGVMRGVFHPQNGQLYGCGLYGWAGNKTKSGGAYRIRYTGRPVHMANELHFVRDGIVLGFTEPLDPASATDSGNYDVKAWNYHWTINYGSPDFKLNGQEGRDTWPVESVALSADRKRVFLKMPDVQRVMQVHVVFNLKAADGAEVQDFVHGTIHKLGSQAGLECLGPGAITHQENSGPKLAGEAPGLIQTLRADKTGGEDTRLARLPALYVPTGDHPTPFLDAGKFHSRWQGFLKADLNDETTFQIEGRGEVSLIINGQQLLSSPGPVLQNVLSHSVKLRRGLNQFDLEYTSPPSGPAELRLAWTAKNLPLEPVPPMMFVHEATDRALNHSSMLREGRQLFAELHCGKCHQPESNWPSNAMPELRADAPAFDGVGNRLNQAWIQQWILDPKKVRPQATMPRMVSGPSATRDAADMAAYLAGLTNRAGSVREHPQPLALGPDLAKSGEKLFNDLGCAGCHLVPGQYTLTNETRLSLAGISEKWRSGALEEYLRSPSQYFHWTRMPGFKLSQEEASSLSAFMLAQSRALAPASPASGSAPAEVIARGQELIQSGGCLSCHSLQNAASRSKAPGLAQLAASSWNRGCLAQDAQGRGAAPDFELSEAERTALRTFAQNGALSALQCDTPEEFAQRQYIALRCQACHSRDTQTDLLTQLAAALPQPKAAADDDEIGANRSVHVGRPALTFAGEKLYSGWTQRFLEGTLAYKPRPDLQGRMPTFGAYAGGLAKGFAHEHGFPAEPAPQGAVDGSLAEIGRRLTGVTDGFSCISCHSIGAQPALAGKDTATVNFACVAERLRPSYYWRYIQDPPHVLPGTMMPKFIGEDGTTQVKAVFNGDPQKQFTAIWYYLQSLQSASTKADKR